jgi:hypothetical protein
MTRQREVGHRSLAGIVRWFEGEGDWSMLDEARRLVDLGLRSPGETL